MTTASWLMSKNCPFYGVAIRVMMTGPCVIAMETSGNQCGLMTEAHSPCVMEISSKAVNWSACPRNPDSRPSRPVPGFTQ